VSIRPQAADGPLPVLYYLSGLTCTHDNFVAKVCERTHLVPFCLLFFFL
jgi:S-formylglutathione hydrolase FrmB